MAALTRTQRMRLIYLSLFVGGVAVELVGAKNAHDDDTITELLIAPLVNFDLGGFPVGWTALMGFLVWLGVHSARRRRGGI